MFLHDIIEDLDLKTLLALSAGKDRNYIKLKEDGWHGEGDAWHGTGNEPRDAWHGTDGAVEEAQTKERNYNNGDRVKLTSEYADHRNPNEVFTVSQCDQERRRCWIGDKQGRGWYAEFEQIMPARSRSVEEGVNFDKLTPQQKAHEYNIDAAQRAMDRRHAEGEDMTGAVIDKKTYEIIKPKQRGVAENEQIDEIFADQGSGSTAKDSAAWEKRRNAVEKMLAKKKLDGLGKQLKSQIAQIKDKGVTEAEGDADGLPHLTKELLQHIVQQVGLEGAHAIVKSLEWGDGAAEELLALILKDLKANISDEEIAEHIGKVKDGYRLYSHKGKNLGTFGSKAGAEKHEREVQYFKHASESLDEDFSDSPVAGAITRRILSQRLDLLKQYGPELVGAAVDNVADFVGEVEEIGSSDVSAWVNQVERMLEENPPEAFAEGVSEDNLNELDIFAPVTTYVRLANGTYVAASWRRNQNLSTASNSASFIDIKPVALNVAKQLGLDQRLNDPEKKYTGVATIASGGPIQSSGPLADRTINVVDISDPKAATDLGVPDTLFGKIAQWAQQQGQKEQGVAEGEQIKERNKQNAIMRKTMDADRGHRYKLCYPVPDAEPEHKTAQAHNKAIGRALRKEPGVTEAKAPSVIQTIRNNVTGVDQLSRDSEGNLVFRKGFYYTNGNSADTFADRISNKLNELNIPHTIIDRGQVWKPFKGGATIKNQSHWWVKVKVGEQGVAEGDVIQHKFGIKQAQKGKTPYYKNPDIEIPMYDPARRANYVAGLSKGQPEAYDHFVVAEVTPTTAHIVGIAKDGTKVKVSTTTKQLADVLVDAYNRGGFTDVALQRVPMGEAEGEQSHGDKLRATPTERLMAFWNKYKDEPGISPVFGQQLKAIANELARRKQKMELLSLHRDNYINRNNDINEATSNEAVTNAIINRIIGSHVSLLGKYGPAAVTSAAEDVAYHVGEVEEIGSSDVSAWVREVFNQLRDNHG